LDLEGENRAFPVAGGADLLAYIGHNAFMDFQIPRVVGKTAAHRREFIVLACASKSYFLPYMRNTQSEPLLWITGLLAPEAYTLDAALEGWTRSESAESIRQRAASASFRWWVVDSRPSVNPLAAELSSVCGLWGAASSR
jgi:hypothetical protein